MAELRDNIYKGLGLFIEAIRPYIVSFLSERAGDEDWENLYIETLYDNQRAHWHNALDKGQDPETLIDFQNLKGFALGKKYELEDDFGKDAHKLATWFDEIYEVRNKTYHHQDVTDEEIKRAFDNMILIMRKLKMDEMVEELKHLKEGKKPEDKQEKISKSSSDELIPWFKNVRPHLDIRQGRLDESIFAANLGEVAFGQGREIYQNPALFFEKTFFTAGLKTVAKRVVEGLNGGKSTENRVISLQTGFGGGKTHTLISLYHLAKWGKKTKKFGEATPLVEHTGTPEFEEANVAVFTNQTNDPVQGRKVEDDIHIKTLWGELAYQLGGKEAYELIRANDENQTAPKGTFKKVLQKTKPALILIDELADYCTSAATVKVEGSNLSDQTISFMQELSETIAASDSCVAVVTLPASVSEVGTSEQASNILTSLENRISRVGADTKPVSDEEIFEVIRRRLFDDIKDDAVVENTISQYMQLYDSLRVELPTKAHRAEYREKLEKSYPFHPELIEMFRSRWASHPNFQRTRGVLRLLASIVSDLWKRQGSLTGTNALIQTSDVNFSNLDALVGQLKKLYGNGYEAVITADVSGPSSNAFMIDQEKGGDYNKNDLTQGICSTVLLGTFGSSDANKGISIKEIKLCMLKPKSFNHNNINGALDALESTAHYLYYSSSGTDTKRYWFRVEPNVNILINKARSEISRPDVNAEILKRIKNRETGINLFNPLVDPDEGIPEQKKPTLIILGPQYLKTQQGLTKETQEWIKKIATKKGNSERIYRNTMLFLVANELGYNKLKESVTDYLASLKIRDDYQSQLEDEQSKELKRKLDESSTDIEGRLVDTYVNVVKYSAKEGPKVKQVKEFKSRLDYQVNVSIQKLLFDEEWLLEGVGYNTLKKYNLLPDKEYHVRVKDVYETFLRYDDKPLITGPDVVRDSLLRYCRNGQFAIAAGEPDNFNNVYYKQDVPYFDVTDETFWLVDESLYQPEEVTPTHPEDFNGDGGGPTATEDDEAAEEEDVEDLTVYKSLKISGTVGLENYTQLFSSFVRPLSNNNVKIEVTIKAQSTEANPITENSNQYKITKESANQLGLNFEAEER